MKGGMARPLGCLLAKITRPPKKEKPVVVTILTGKCPCTSALVWRREVFHHPAQIKNAGYKFLTSFICYANQPNPELRSAQHLRRPGTFRTVHTAETPGKCKTKCDCVIHDSMCWTLERSPQCAFLELKLLHFIRISPNRILRNSSSSKIKISANRKKLIFLPQFWMSDEQKNERVVRSCYKIWCFRPILCGLIDQFALCLSLDVWRARNEERCARFT